MKRTEPSTSAARKPPGVDPATRILKECYEQVQAEMTKTLKALDSPLDTAAAQLIESHRERLERSDAQRRKAVLAAVDEALALGLAVSSAASRTPA